MNEQRAVPWFAALWGPATAQGERLAPITSRLRWDGESGPACPSCLGENLEYVLYDFGTDRETGYSDSGERYHCRDCGATGDVDDTAAVPVMLPQAIRKPMGLALGRAALPGLA